MNSSSRAGRFVSVSMLSVSMALGAAACRTTTEDVQRWANTSQGPRKLVSVVTHDKYERDLRVEAAMTLIGMKPRSGRRVGITQLVDALNAMPEAERTTIVTGLVPRLVEEMKKPAEGVGDARVDTSVPYKDAAHAMLTNDGGSLVTDPVQIEALKVSLTEWANTDFASRLDDSSQMYGVEQVLRYLGHRGVKALPNVIAVDGTKNDRASDLVAELGDADTKVAASQKLVAMAREINSDKWLKARAPKVEAANKAAKLAPTPDQFQKQLDAYQEEELLRVFQAMKKVGQKPAVEYLLNFAMDGKEAEKQRGTALAALEGNLDKNDKSQVDRILKLAAAADTPDPVRDAALRRVGEMPRDKVVDRIYPLFNNPNWKIRWVAAELVLRLSDQSQLDEFMSKLGDVKGMSITEPLRYGSLLADLKGKSKPASLADKYAQKRYSSPVRLSALGYYYEHGTKAELAKVNAFSSDKTEVPGCLPDAKECEWKCTVGGESKEVKTVGDFVELCVSPAMKGRATTEKREPGEPGK